MIDISGKTEVREDWLALQEENQQIQVKFGADRLANKLVFSWFCLAHLWGYILRVARWLWYITLSQLQRACAVGCAILLGRWFALFMCTSQHAIVVEKFAKIEFIAGESILLSFHKAGYIQEEVGSWHWVPRRICCIRSTTAGWSLCLLSFAVESSFDYRVNLSQRF